MVAATVSAPAINEVGTLATATNPFPDNSWAGKTATGLSNAQFAYTFQAAEAGYEVGDSINVWNAPSPTGLLS